MRLPPPQPGLQNVLLASHSLSYLSTTAHVHGTPRPPVLVHAAHDNLLSYATTHITLESPTCTILVPQRLHFRPLHLALHCAGPLATVVIAGPDGALAATVDLAAHAVVHPLTPLPGSAGYSTVAVALNREFVAAAALDGRVAVWRDPRAPATHVVELPSQNSDRVTDLALVDGGLLIAWWSGRLVFYSLRADRNRVLWDMTAVAVNKDTFGRFPGCYIVVRNSIVAFVTGRGDLVFVRLLDGAHVVTKVGEYVKGMCHHDNRLNLVVDGSLIPHEWITQAELDKTGTPTPDE